MSVSDMIAMERHFTVKELAELWGFSEDSILRMFRDEPGVLKVGRGGLSRYAPRSGQRQQRIAMRIPVSVAQRVHDRLGA